MDPVMTKPTMPVFVFDRRSDIECANDFLLAGQLIVDIPKYKELQRRDQQLIIEIIQELTKAAMLGQLPADTLAIGWLGGCRPANAVDTDNDAVVTAWAQDRLTIALRIPRSLDELVRIDDDVLMQMGLVKRH
jgi:hypothetical protein